MSKGTFGIKWNKHWVEAGSTECKTCPNCCVSHVNSNGYANILIKGECLKCSSFPKIGLYGLNKENLLENIMKYELNCGHLNVGIKEIWINLTKDIVVYFDIRGMCYNKFCKKTEDVVVLVGKDCEITKEKESVKCCENPRIAIFHFSVKFMEYDSEFKINFKKLYYSQNSISKDFQHNEKLSTALVKLIKKGDDYIDEIFCPLEVFFFEDRFYSLDNRRLYLIKNYAEINARKILKVRCKLVKYSENRKIQKKFTTKTKGETIEVLGPKIK